MSINTVRTIKAVVFDIDGTLTEHNSWYAFTRDIGGSEAEHLAIYEGQRNGIIGFDEAKQKLLEMWQKSGKANRKSILEIYNHWDIRPEAYPLAKWLHSSGYRTCLITGSVKIYAEIISRKLGIKDNYANADLYFNEKDELEAFHYDTDQASVKVDQFAMFCKKYKLNPEECVAVGDGDNDIGLFNLTGNGILVDNSKVSEELKKSAWKTVSNLDEIKDLLQANTSR